MQTNVLKYLSTDEVNIAHARALADLHGFELEPVEPGDLPSLDGTGVLLDWHSIPATDRDQVLRRGLVLAVHGYDLDDGDASFLPERGILVSPRLSPELFRDLRQAPTPPKRVVVGSASLNRSATATSIRLEAKNRLYSQLTTDGGGGANIARANKRLAPERTVVLLAQRGDDLDGEWLRQTLQQQGVELPLKPVAGVPTSFSYIVIHAATGHSTVFSEPGARSEPLPLEAVERALAGAEMLWLVAPPWNNVIRPLSELAAQKRVPLFFGLGTMQIDGLGYTGLGRELAGPVELLACNRQEAEQFTGRASVAEQLAALNYRGQVRVVVVTDGANGIHAWRDGQVSHVPAWSDPRRPVVDDTGAGDAAQATIGHLLLRGATLTEALRGGVRQGFECCTAVGANARLLSAADLHEYLATPDETGVA
jgi:sugar/nucleoside kinase (ribokinase family)